MSGEIVPVYGWIYVYANLVNGKLYFGQTVQILKRRIRQHLYALGRPDKSYGRTPLYSAMRKYGVNNLFIVCLRSCQTPEELDLMEDLYITAFGTLDLEHGYNLKRGGAEGRVSDRSIWTTKKGNKNPAYRHDVVTQDIIDLHKIDPNTFEIARKLGVSRDLVADRLRGAGIVLTAVRRGPKLQENSHWRNDINVNDLIRCCESGMDKLSMAGKFNLSQGTITRRFALAGYSPKWKSKQYAGEKNPNYRTEIDAATVARLYLVEEYTTQQLSEMYSISPRAIIRRLKIQGIKIKTGPRPKNVKPITNSRGPALPADSIRPAVEL